MKWRKIDVALNGCIHAQFLTPLINYTQDNIKWNICRSNLFIEVKEQDKTLQHLIELEMTIHKPFVILGGENMKLKEFFLKVTPQGICFS